MAGGANPDGTRPSDRVTFTRQDADRIGRTVRAYEGGDRRGAPLKYDHWLYRNPDVFRMAKFTGDSSGGWAVGSQATITFTNVIFGGETAIAINKFCSIGGGGSAEVGVARDISNTWSLISWPMQEVCDVVLEDVSISLNTETCAILKTLHTATTQYLKLTFPYVTCGGQD